MDLLAQACRRRQKYGQRARSTLPDVFRRQSLQEVGHQSFPPRQRLWPDLRSVGKRCAWIHALTAGLTPRARVHAALRVVMAVTGFFAGAGLLSRSPFGTPG